MAFLITTLAINILNDTVDMVRVVNGDLGLSDINYACGLLPRLNPPYIKLSLSDRSFDTRIVLTLCRSYCGVKPIGNSCRNTSCSFAVPLQ